MLRNGNYALSSIGLSETLTKQAKLACLKIVATPIFSPFFKKTPHCDETSGLNI